MGCAIAAALGLCVMLAVGDGEPAVTARQFGEWFAAASRGELEVPESVERHALRFRYVFIGGFGGEKMPGYFAQNARELRAHGVADEAIRTIRPRSSRTVEENRDEVGEAIRTVAAEGPERLVLIAHSRGACDALAFSLHNPGFVHDRVEAIFLIQGPFGGSALADYVVGEGEPIEGKGTGAHALIARLIGHRERSLMEAGRHAGLAGLTREASKAYWARLLEEHAEAIPIVDPVLYFVESRATPEDLRLFQRSMARYLAGCDDRLNDGMVAVGDQSILGLGTHLGVLDAGHADLTRRFPATREGRHARRALVDGILMTLGVRQDFDRVEGVDPGLLKISAEGANIPR